MSAITREREVANQLHKIADAAEQDWSSYWAEQIRARANDLLALAPSQPPPPAQGWRDMASAPTDGTRILVWLGLSHRVLEFETGGRYPNTWTDGEYHWAPTDEMHWMPLPDPPTLTASQPGRPKTT